MGGNKKAKDFFESQPDYSSTMSMHEKYHSTCAALYRDKVEYTWKKRMDVLFNKLS